MDKKSLVSRIKRLVKLIYLKFFRINDTPAKIALGFGLGVFIGVMPAVGPVIALFLAFLLRINRASALLGSILSNTWVGFLVLLFAIKTGSLVLGVNYQDVYFNWNQLFKDFKWERFFEASILKVLVPIGVGYLIISLIFAVVATLLVYIIVKVIGVKKNI
ncbi:MAG: DUF2062 domain-containing protein [Candidatus Omnitrophota bacterium]